MEPDEEFKAAHAYRIAWWAPLLHLLLYGLGWPRPDQGLQRWDRLGRPNSDPILTTVERWWGSELEGFLAWCAVSGTAFSQIVNLARTAAGTQNAISASRLLATDLDVTKSSEWLATWGGGGDSLHLSTHVVTPASELRGDPLSSVQFLVPQATESRRATLLLDGYAGWYRNLSERGSQLPARPDGRYWQVDVIVRQLGWLGTYRQSRESGRWFSGRHRWHQLGID